MACERPFVKDGQPLPCGKCNKCRLRRASGWSFRLLKEAERSSSAFFITLTYNNEHCPITKNGFMTLVKKDVQFYIKKVRKLHYQYRINPKYYAGSGLRKKIKVYKTGIKYYAVGEYGSRTKRPHYHIIIFNLELEKILDKETFAAVKTGLISLDGKTNISTKAWEKDGKEIGQITIGLLSPASAAYTLKYISKESKVSMHKNDDRLKEFSLMSKGLGSNYLSKDIIKMHQNDPMRQYISLYDGKKIALPRYFKERLYDSLEREEIAKIMAQKAAEEQYKKSTQTLLKETKLKKAHREKPIKRPFEDSEKI